MNIREDVVHVFKQKFADDPIVVRSPGRVNIIGEHTDYNNGFVLPGAIDKSVYVAVSLRTNKEIHLYAHDLQESFIISIEDLKPTAGLMWPNYILGAAAQLIKREIPLKGFNMVLTSDLPIGAGLSSSAAIECATLFALNHLLQANLAKIDMVKMAQQAEHEYAGVMCGIMDQFASMMGKKNHVLKLDCRSLSYEYVPFNMEGVKILLLNTNVKHSLATSEYNTRNAECKKAVALVNEHHSEVNDLRDATMHMLNNYVLPKDKLVYNRSAFVVREIDRLLQGCEDLKRGDLQALGQKMFETHKGLSEQYEVSCKELDWLVDAVKTNDAVIGSRMMGGGFGGCTISLVTANAIEPLVAALQPAYEAAMHMPLDYYVVTIEDGTELIYA